MGLSAAVLPLAILLLRALPQRATPCLAAVALMAACTALYTASLPAARTVSSTLGIVQAEISRAPPATACAEDSDACVTCTTTKGDFTIAMHRAWAPLGYDRFMELVRAGFFDDQLIYRTLPGFLVQFGVAADPSVQATWSHKTIRDDLQKHIPFLQGTVSFAGSGPDSRSTHVFIALDPHGGALGKAWHERPFGRIDNRRHQQIVASMESRYGDLTFLQGKLMQEGNGAAGQYPLLDRIKRCSIEPVLVLEADARAEGQQMRLGHSSGTTVWLHTQALPLLPIPILLNPDGVAAETAARLAWLAARNTSGRIHRAEPQPSSGSSGPPYALIQFSLNDSSLAGLAHEGRAPITRGAVCLIGRSSDLFISLARHGEHTGWESSMTIVGHVVERELAVFESAILGQPRHNFTHPSFGTRMSMLDHELRCSIQLVP
jgi:peptidyl-prolyl cis-trans isomerase A (cyclophilin A)